MEQLLNTARAAEYLGVHPETVREWVREGILKAVKVGKNLRYKTSELERAQRDSKVKRVSIAVPDDLERAVSMLCATTTPQPGKSLMEALASEAYRIGIFYLAHKRLGGLP